VAICVFLLMMTALSLAIEQKELADTLAVVAFLFLAVGIGLETVSLPELPMDLVIGFKLEIWFSRSTHNHEKKGELYKT
jgi:hypothetical protein